MEIATKGMMSLKQKVLIVVLLLIVSFAYGNDTFAKIGAYPQSNLLVSTDWLVENQGTNFYIVDVRSEGFEENHIPGAVHFDMEMLVDDNHPIEGHLVSEQVFEQLMNDLGVRNDQTIVVYDEGNDTAATRLFYALEYYGHEDIHVLNGGFKAWKAMHHECSNVETVKQLGAFKARKKNKLMVEKDYVEQVIFHDDVVLLDVRSPEEYKGEDVRAKRGGHIPTAVNLEWKAVIKEDGVPFFKSAEDISSLLKQVDVPKEKKVVVYCQLANRSSHMYFTLRLMGYSDITVYEGSWAEWGNDPKTPIDNPSKFKKGLRSL
ncbi:sulfurtransferase [Halalkalibacter kiskunsagensis]|uniref:thiosulfate sulfurtransferase n=1 Tax=Halalkalibacter kiskunsagensis TaxID=1548599 RepID=A0ABV6K8T0_9BACI